MAGVLKIYSNYVQNFDSALRMLDEVKKKEKISHFLSVCNLYNKRKLTCAIQETRNVPEVRNLDIASFLIMPVQRIPVCVSCFLSIETHFSIIEIQLTVTRITKTYLE